MCLISNDEGWWWNLRFKGWKKNWQMPSRDSRSIWSSLCTDSNSWGLMAGWFDDGESDRFVAILCVVGTFMYGYMLHDVQLANLEDSGCSPDMCVLSLSPAREQYAFMDWFAMLSTWGVTIHTLPYSPNSQIFTRHHTQIPCFYLNKKRPKRNSPTMSRGSCAVAWVSLLSRKCKVSWNNRSNEPRWGSCPEKWSNLHTLCAASTLKWCIYLHLVDLYGKW